MDSTLCRNCNTYFGGQEGLCSKCFKETKLKEKSLLAVSEVLNMLPQIIEESKNIPVISPDRCAQCQKKLSLSNFKCKCEFVFCSRHRLPEEHNCTFDHKAFGIRKLSQENPLVQGEKFNKL